MKTIQAVFENGVFRPIGPVDLPENSKVEFEPRPRAEAGSDPSREAALSRVYAILSRRHNSGDPFGSEWHNEHQPFA